MSTQTTLASINAPLQEQILVVKRATLFVDGTWHGINNKRMDEYLNIIQNNREFHARALMENDPTYKQIIPYLIFQFEDQYFLMQRKAKASETRLAGKFTLGIGGHMRAEDMEGSSIFDWARREFHEEISYDGTFTIAPLGILNDDSDAVGQVHVGLVLLLKGDSPNIHVKEELHQGFLASIAECEQYLEKMENWSKHIVHLLMSKKA
ncbi:MAG TPA: hypothetical protein VFF04_03505 [Candidatus Babeliales bacterium]|nr:hypothetical protein [Candidatus Babeliales bacterium]